jgi:hypothetical protein
MSLTRSRSSGAGAGFVDSATVSKGPMRQREASDLDWVRIVGAAASGAHTSCASGSWALEAPASTIRTTLNEALAPVLAFLRLGGSPDRTTLEPGATRDRLLACLASRRLAHSSPRRPASVSTLFVGIPQDLTRRPPAAGASRVRSSGPGLGGQADHPDADPVRADGAELAAAPAADAGAPPPPPPRGEGTWSGTSFARPIWPRRRSKKSRALRRPRARPKPLAAPVRPARAAPLYRFRCPG